MRKFNDEKMRHIHSEYYDKDGFVRRDETTGRLKKEHLRAARSEVSDVIIKENRYFFDILEMDHDVIRFNLTRYNDCGCRYFLMDRNDLERLEKFIHDYLNDII